MPTVQLNFRIDKGLKAMVMSLLDAQGKTERGALAQFVREAIVEKLAREQGS